MRIACCSMVIFLCLILIPVVSCDKWEHRDGFEFNLMRDENRKLHETEFLPPHEGLHVRRNLPIHLKLRPCKTCNKNCKDSYEFKLTSNQYSPLSWSKVRPAPKNSELDFELFVSSTVPVGDKYTLTVKDPCFKPDTVGLCDVNVMFNPSRKFNSIESYEYIRNNNGYIWKGENEAIHWQYAVGSDVVTESLHKMAGLMKYDDKKDPVLFSRALTQLISEKVLIGRWKEPYNVPAGSYEPTQWVGSDGILKIWLDKNEPVRYGQCWVFAALLTTFLRASGIPARTVTNCDSHHDRGLTDDKTAILRPFDNEVQSDESTWNFHVWSEAWLERDDLSKGLVGWNALDATRQEPSPLQPKPHAVYRSGPTLVQYIRQNKRNANYDTLFVLAEVNAKGFCPQTQSRKVGTKVLTKKASGSIDAYNKNNPHEITTNYKLITAVEEAADSGALLPECQLPGGMRIKSYPAKPQVGDDFIIEVMEGRVPVEDTVVRMELWSYSGFSLNHIHDFKGSRRIDIKENSYRRYLGASNAFRFTVGEYNSRKFIPHDTLHLSLEYKPVKVDTRTAGKSITLSITYTNPLSIPMTGVVMNIAHPNFEYSRIQLPNIPANGPFRHTLSVECGANTDKNVMIPVSLDSVETQSAHGVGQASCAREDVTIAWKYLMTILRTI